MKVKTVVGICLVLILGSFFFYLFLFPLPKYPRTFVKNVTFEHEKSLFFILNSIRYPVYGNVTKFKVENQTVSIGVATETTLLNFGRVPLNFTVRKVINLKNYENVPVKVKLRSFGNIKDFISFDKNNFILQPNEETKVYVIFNTTRIGNYVGEVDVMIKKPRYSFLLPMIEVV